MKAFKNETIKESFPVTGYNEGKNRCIRREIMVLSEVWRGNKATEARRREKGEGRREKREERLKTGFGSMEKEDL